MQVCSHAHSYILYVSSTHDAFSYKELVCMELNLCLATKNWGLNSHLCHKEVHPCIHKFSSM